MRDDGKKETRRRDSMLRGILLYLHLLAQVLLLGLGGLQALLRPQQLLLLLLHLLLHLGLLEAHLERSKKGD